MPRGVYRRKQETPPTQPPPQPQQKNGLQRVGALWKRKSKNGNVYLSGVCDDSRIMIFPVKPEYKTSDKSPDYTIMRSLEDDTIESKASEDSADIPF